MIYLTESPETLKLFTLVFFTALADYIFRLLSDVKVGIKVIKQQRVSSRSSTEKILMDDI